MSYEVVLIIAGALLIIVVLNVGFVIKARRGEYGRNLELLNRMYKAARNPWKQEDQNLANLHNAVSKLQKESSEAPSDPGNE